MLKTTTFAINLLLAGAVFAADDSSSDSSPHSSPLSLSSVSDSEALLNLRDNATAKKLPDGSVQLSKSLSDNGSTLIDKDKPLATKYDELLTYPIGDIEDLFKNQIRTATSFPVSDLVALLSQFQESEKQTSKDYKRHTFRHKGIGHAAFIDSSAYSLDGFKKCIYCYYDPVSASASAGFDGIIYPIKTFESNGDIRTYSIKILSDNDEVKSSDSPLRGRSKSEITGRAQLRQPEAVKTTESPETSALSSSRSYSSSTSSSSIVTPTSPKTSPTQRKVTILGALSPRSQEASKVDTPSGTLSPRSQKASSSTPKPSSSPEKTSFFDKLRRKNSSKNLKKDGVTSSASLSPKEARKEVVTSSAPSPSNVGGNPTPFTQVNSKELQQKLAKQLSKSKDQ